MDLAAKLGVQVQGFDVCSCDSRNVELVLTCGLGGAHLSVNFVEHFDNGSRVQIGVGDRNSRAAACGVRLVDPLQLVGGGQVFQIAVDLVLNVGSRIGDTDLLDAVPIRSSAAREAGGDQISHRNIGQRDTEAVVCGAAVVGPNHVDHILRGLVSRRCQGHGALV